MTVQAFFDGEVGDDVDPFKEFILIDHQGELTITQYKTLDDDMSYYHDLRPLARKTTDSSVRPGFHLMAVHENGTPMARPTVTRYKRLPMVGMGLLNARYDHCQTRDRFKQAHM